MAKIIQAVRTAERPVSPFVWGFLWDGSCAFWVFPEDGKTCSSHLKIVWRRLKNRSAESEKSFGAENLRGKMNAEIWHVDIYFIIFATEKAIGHHEKKKYSFFPFIFIVCGLGLRRPFG